MEPYAPDIVYCYAGCMHEDTGEISKKEQARYGGVPGGLTGVANELVFLKWPMYCPACRPSTEVDRPSAHWCCGHPIGGGYAGLSNISFRLDKPSDPYISITHPRWCPDCVEVRTRALVENAKLSESYNSVEEAAASAELVWKLGVLDGRVAAQIMDLERWSLVGAVDAFLKTPQTRGKQQDNGKPCEVVEQLLKSMKASQLEQYKEKTDDELRTLIVETVRYDLRTHAYQDLAANYQDGKIEGVDFQLKFEKIVMGAGDPLARTGDMEASLAVHDVPCEDRKSQIQRSQIGRRSSYEVVGEKWWACQRVPDL